MYEGAMAGMKISSYGNSFTAHLHQAVLPDVGVGLLLQAEGQGGDLHVTARQINLRDGGLLLTESTQNGKGLLIGVGQQGDSAESLVDINKLAKVFGVTFSGSVEDSDELQVSKFADTFGAASEILGKYYNMKIIKVLDQWRE